MLAFEQSSCGAWNVTQLVLHARPPRWITMFGVYTRTHTHTFQRARGFSFRLLAFGLPFDKFPLLVLVVVAVVVVVDDDDV